MATGITSSVKTAFAGDMASEVVIQFNKLLTVVSGMMPGLLTSAPASKAGTTAATAWRTEDFGVRHRGKELTASAQEKAFTATTHDTAASKESWYVLSVQSDASTFTITKGADQTIGTKLLPTVPDNEVAVSYLQMITGAGGIWDASTDDLAVGGNVVTLVFEDMPAVQYIGSGSPLAAIS